MFKFFILRSALLAMLAVASPLLVNNANAMVSAEFSGAWFDPSHDGEGFILEVLDNQNVVLYWFTYDGEGNQRWIGGVGQIDGDMITFPTVRQARGARFGDAFDPDDIVRTEVGTVTFTFSSCAAGTVNYTIDGVAGMQVLRRLTEIAGHDCSGLKRRSSVLLSGISGSWFLPSRNGEGFVVELIAPGTLGIFWFTFDADGEQAWYSGIGTIVDGKVEFQQVVAPRGASFGADFDPADVERVAWGQISFELSCNSIDYSYNSPVSGNGSGSVVRLTQIDNTQCSDEPVLATQLDAMINTQVNAQNFELGASYAVESLISGAQWEGVAGTASAGGPVLSGQHAFVTNSVGTFYTAALVWRLVEQGELSLDATLDTYLPINSITGLVVFDGVDRTTEITVSNLLGHRSGLPRLLQPPVAGAAALIDQIQADPNRVRLPVELINYARTSLAAHSRPGTDLVFSELNYVLLAEVIESVTGEGLEQSFKRLISQPAGMTATWSLGRESVPAGVLLAASQIGDLDVSQFPAFRSLGAGSDWATTKADLGRFMRALFSGDLFASPGTLAQLVSPDSNFLGIVDIGLGGMTRSDDCGLPEASLQGFIGDGAFAIYIPQRQAYLYGFAIRADYFGIGYLSDVLEATFSSGACRDAGSWSSAESPEMAGFSSAGLAEVGAFLQNTDASALMVIADGKAVYEYGLIGRRYLAHSIRKSFASALFGVEVTNGTINLDASMSDLGIDDVTPLSTLERTATVRHLLQSRSGIYLPAAGSDNNFGDGSLPPRGSAVPGGAFFYNNWDFNTAGAIYEQATGSSIFDRFISDIAIRIGMDDIRRQDQFYLYERLASRYPAYGFTVTARDMARFGQLFLQQGSWNGEQIIEPNWVSESIQTYSLTGDQSRPGFGYMNWSTVDNNRYMATGRGGHKILVLPDQNMVIVIRVDTYNEGTIVTDEAFFEVVDMILNARQ